jgi:hypothetical protein
MEGTSRVPGSCVTVFPGSPDRVVIHGDIDIRTAPEIDDAFSALTGDVQVNCVGVGFIDTAGSTPSTAPTTPPGYAARRSPCRA